MLKQINKRYHVSDSGEVFRDGIRVKSHLNTDGYVCVAITNGQGFKTCKIHRLVALAFIPNPENKPTVNHKDGDKLNNSVLNLEWATRQEQSDHASKLGLLHACRGDASVRSKLTTPQVIEILTSRESLRVLSQRYGVTKTTVSDIKHKRRWKHISQDMLTPKEPESVTEPLEAKSRRV